MSFIRFRSHGSNDDRFALFGRGKSNGTDVGSELISPFGVTIQEQSIVSPSAPGGGNSYGNRLKVNSFLVGPTISLVDPSTSMRGAVGVDIATPLLHLLQQSNGGSPGVVTLNLAFRYLCDAGNDDISLYAAGDESSNLTLAGTDRFFGFEGNSAGEGTATESAVQIDWPVPGVFVFLAAQIGVGAATTANMFLRKNGVDTALGITGATGAAISPYADLTDTVAVVAGDLVDFRFVRTGGVGVVFSAGVIVGFRSVT